MWVYYSFLLGAKQHLELSNEIIPLWSTLVWQVLLQVSHHSVVISYINASTFLQGSRQQFNVEECAWWIQEGARPIQLIAAIKLLTRNVCDLLKISSAPSMLELSFLQWLHCWSRDLAACHVTNALQTEQPNSHFSEQGKCHHHGWWSGAPLLFWFKSFNTSSSFSSLLLLPCVPRGGRRRVSLPILLGLAPLSKQSNFLTCNLQVFKSSQRGGWYESPPPWQGRHVSWFQVSYFSKVPQTRSGQVWLEAAQAESWKAWTICLVRLWTCQDSPTSLWWHLSGKLDRGAQVITSNFGRI